MIKSMFRKIIARLRDRYFRPLVKKNEQQDYMMGALADASFRTRALHKNSKNHPIHVLFVCHMPSLWGMFDTVYKAVCKDTKFIATVVVLPYKHDTLSEGQYKDEGGVKFLQNKGINAIQGYDEENGEWLNPISVDPDYVFFQTPYSLFPRPWTIDTISMFSRICYLSYGTCLFSGDVEKTVHHISLYRYTYFCFMENRVTEKFFKDNFSKEKWFSNKKVVLTGHPKLDSLIGDNEIYGKARKQEIKEDLKYILWTPRWRTNEGTCHFFDYKNYFIDFCNNHSEINFVFRPHPLCLQNFLKTGELSIDELDKMESIYDKKFNMSIDREGDYVDTFLSSDILISDVSSMLLEYFVTGKPIIYSNRVDVFNDLGKQLSEGMYWVNNINELDTTLKMLLSGNDPLKSKRKKIIQDLFCIPIGGAGEQIKEYLKSDYFSCVNISTEGQV